MYTVSEGISYFLYVACLKKNTVYNDHNIFFSIYPALSIIQQWYGTLMEM